MPDIFFQDFKKGKKRRLFLDVVEILNSWDILCFETRLLEESGEQ